MVDSMVAGRPRTSAQFGSDVDVDWNRTQRRYGREGGVESTIGQDGWVEPAGQRTNVGDRVPGLAMRVVEQGTEHGVVRRFGARLCVTQRDRHCHQTLLGAVVEVPFDAQSLRLRRVDDPCPAVRQLFYTCFLRGRAQK